MQNIQTPINILSPTNSCNPYQQQFYKLKSQRLESQLKQIKNENKLLSEKMRDINVSLQLIKQGSQIKQQLTEDNLLSYRSKEYNSEYMSSFPDSKEGSRINTTEDINKLIKHIRILKNEHQIQLLNLNELIKKLRKSNSQLQLTIEQISRQHNKKQQVSNFLFRNQISKESWEIKNISNTNQKLKRQIANQQQNHQQSKLKLLQLQNQITTLRQKLKQQSNAHLFEKKNHEPENKTDNLQKQIKFLKQKLQQKQKNILSLKTQVEQTKMKINDQVKIAVQLQKHQNINQMRHLQNKIKLLMNQILQKQSTFKSILMKLKPQYQEKNKQNKQNRKTFQEKACLTLLQYLLKKYKIQTF